MIKRMMGAARLDAAIYEEVESDPSATKQALTVVILVALATGLARLGQAAQRGLWSVS